MAKQKTDLEGIFWFQIRAKGFDKGCEPQLKAIESRRFRWDYGWRDHNLLVEIQGSLWVKGGHNTGTGLKRDHEKNNFATIAGWHILYFNSDTIKDGTAICQLEEYFNARKLQGTNHQGKG